MTPEDVLEALVSNNRSKLSKTFGPGMFVSETETPEEVITKCESYIERFETYINHLKIVINSGEKLNSETVSYTHLTLPTTSRG